MLSDGNYAQQLFNLQQPQVSDHSINKCLQIVDLPFQQEIV